MSADPFARTSSRTWPACLAALWCILATGELDRASRHALFALSLLSPALPFLDVCPHPEVFTFSMVTLALLWNAESGLRYILAAALGAAQNPPLVWLVAAAAGLPPRGRFLGGARGTPGARRRDDGGRRSPALPAWSSTWTFGTPSVIVRESTSWSNLSLGRALELPGPQHRNAPVPPVHARLLPGGRSSRVWRVASPLRTARLAGLLLVLALSCSLTANCNDERAGPAAT